MLSGDAKGPSNSSCLRRTAALSCCVLYGGPTNIGGRPVLLFLGEKAFNLSSSQDG
jgi:hypothetical protein